MKTWVIALSALAITGVTGALIAAGAAVSVEAVREEVAVTIYNGNFGLVRDVRDMSLPGGVSVLEFPHVAALIDPTTVNVKSLTSPASLRVLEQNYEYDLLSPEKLMNKYVGKKVKLLTSEGAVIEAVLLSNNNGPIYEINGEIHMGHPGRVVLPVVPKELIPKPTLVWHLENSSVGNHRVEVSYLTSGITWKADYVVTADAADRMADIAGWVTLDNKSGASYENAALKLVAGDVHRVTPPDQMPRVMEMMAKADAAAGRFVEEGLFEYHLYTLQGKTTVKDNQTKQVGLMTAAAVPIRKILTFRGMDHFYLSHYGGRLPKQKVNVALEIDNTQKNNLGLPLPKGIVRVYKADSSGSLQFIGEDLIDHTPKDEKLKVRMGDAFDVVGERVQKDYQVLGTNTYEVEWEISLRNHKKEEVQVTIIEPVPGDWSVVKSTHPYDKTEAHTLEYVVKVPADGQVKVAYRVRFKH